MKAVVYTEYGPPKVLQLQEVAKPVPKDKVLTAQKLARNERPVRYSASSCGFRIETHKKEKNQ